MTTTHEPGAPVQTETIVLPPPAETTSASPAGSTQVLEPASPTQPPTASAGVRTPPPTIVVVREEVAEPERRRSTTGFRRADVFALLGSFVAALSLTAWLFTQLQIFRGIPGFVIVTFLLFIAFYALVLRLDESDLAIRDRIVAVVVHSIALLLLFTLAVVVIFTFVRGFGALLNWNFFVTDMSETGPLDGLDSGGILHAIAGTLIMIALALAWSIPLGLLTAIYLSEFGGRFARVIRTVVEAMTALPSIVAGLFIYATVVLILGMDRSGFAASLAMTVMMLPIIIRSADVVLRLVPGNLKEASYALGSSRWRTVLFVTLPTARSGLTTAIILGTARGIGETSPVLLTAGFTTYLNLNPFSGAMVSLPLATFNFVKSPEPEMIARGFGAAAVLMVLVLLLFAVARLIGGRGPGVLTRGQLRRRASRSRSDDYRFRAREVAAQRANTIETTGYAGMGFARADPPPPAPDPTGTTGPIDGGSR